MTTTHAELGACGVLACGPYLETFLLAAQAQGVGAVPRRRWAAHAPFTRTHFGIPEDRLVVCGMSFGWPDRDHAANGFRTRRASTEDNITWIQ